MIKRLISLILILWSAISAVAYSVDQIPNVHLSDSRRYTSDPDGVLSPAARATIDSLAADLRQKSSAEIAVVIVNSIDGADPEEFATELFNTWKIGKKESNNGVLVLTVMDENYCIIRTGYGAEGVLPDITTGRIRREIMNPYFRNGQPDSAMTEGVRAIHTVMTDPKAAEELLDTYARNREENNSREERDELVHILFLMIAVGAGATVIILLLYGSNKSHKDGNTSEMYRSLTNLQTGALAASFIGLGIPLLAYFYLRNKRKNLRTTAPLCKRCSTPMLRVDNRMKLTYLTPQQQTEQRLGSADYDVWQCPKDGSIEVREFPGSTGKYTRCPKCGTRARHQVSNVIIHHPTPYRNGQGQRRYHCEYCGNDDFTNYVIMRQRPVVVGGGGSSRGFGGGGFGGGSFGGGLSGGGGSGGRW